MKNSILKIAVAIIAMAGTSCATTGANLNPQTETAKIQAKHDGMFFDVHGVVDNIWYGTESDGAWYLIYDDVDAGLTYEAIRVDKATYLTVLDALEDNSELCGTLVATQEYETIEYTLKSE